MNGNGSIELKGTVEEVWSKLMDPSILSKCIMGCKSLELIGEDKYKADLQIGIAAVKGKYDAIIEVTDIKPPYHYKLLVNGEGGPGFVNAEGVIDLTPINDECTQLTYTYSAEVGGKVAAIGQRMLGGVAKLLISDFFKKIQKEIAKSKQEAS
ncbi:hypothetical conserved protein (plasmid) [Geobacillus kaustophilus HTA426]|uniref:Hypothetical conserved protein n=1 Tax=Geobacillus kaustophilus (strain HTA426) TaxID=235909 RepID=Q5QL47_GEOKA|nr:carbon monoxide dehydrogenase subunit G [Geobacillus kaustophilus]BAD74263.1 hypothetical conserved protein [Geobacillus kaustophilus HTA426]